MPLSTQMPRDDDGAPVPVLGFRPGGAFHLPVTATSTRIGPFSSGTCIVSLVSDGPLHFAVGGPDVTATIADHYLPAGLYLDLSLGGGKRELRTHLAAVRAVENCTLHLSERE